MNKKEKETLKKNALEYLHEAIKPGDRVYTVLNRKSASGTTRHISCYIATIYDGKPGIRNISHLVAAALELRRNFDTGGVVVTGCGMDMGFHLVYELSSVMFFDTVKKGAAGYVLKHEWL